MPRVGRKAKAVETTANRTARAGDARRSGNGADATAHRPHRRGKPVQEEEEATLASMEWVETTGKTVEEAKDAALDQLGVDEQDAEFEVIEEPRTGLFGRTRGEARVRARVRPDAASTQGRAA